MPIRTILGVYIIIDFVALILFASSFGAIATLALIIGSGICGVQLMRKEGRQTLQDMQTSLAEGQQSLGGIMRNSAFLLGGLLMILPGPISDVLGLAMVLPTLLRRDRRSGTTGHTYEGEASTTRSHEGNIIEGEYIERDTRRDDEPRQH